MIKTLKGKVRENITLTKDYRLLQIKTDSFFAFRPGQFINIKVTNTLSPFLRRPFSIFNYEDNVITVLYKVVGEGTGLLSELKINDTVDLLGPLGNGFTLQEGNNLLVAGGVGLGGIFYLTRFLKNYKLLVGVNTEKEKDAIRTILEEDAVVVSMEKDGTVVDYLNGIEVNADFIYSCGPEIMMKNLYEKYMLVHNIPGEFSLEAHMACGIGVCMGCVKKIKTSENNIEYLRVCKDGPVFSADAVVWE